jgi:hypothetical protein
MGPSKSQYNIPVGRLEFNNTDRHASTTLSMTSTSNIRSRHPERSRRMITKNNVFIFVLFYFVFIFAPKTISAQDLTNIKDAKPVKVTGGLGLTETNYYVDGMNSRRDPFTYTLNGNMNFNLYGIIDVPLSIYYTKQNSTFNKPSFNYFGISPRYKAVTVHMGYRNMQFSSYTLSGITFFGVGIEIQPEKSLVKYKAVYGRFIKAVPYGDTINATMQPAFARWGYGNMITIGKRNNYVDLILFKADDRLGTLSAPAGSDTLCPQENIVMGIATKQAIGKRFFVTGEYDASAFTTDARLPSEKPSTYRLVNYMGPLFSPNYSTQFHNVYQTALNYQGESYTLGVSYKRVDPGYKSMGTIYLQDDLADYLVNATKTLFSNKMSLSGSLGFQKNNLDNKQEATNKRVIGSLNGSYAFSDKLNVALNYSNFNAMSRPTMILMKDSIKFAQVTTNYGATVNYSLKNDKFNHSFMLNANYQIANILNPTVSGIARTGTQMNNALFSYRAQHNATDWAFTTSASYNDYKQDSVRNITLGPVFGVSKSFLKKKLRSMASVSLLNNFVNGERYYGINVLRLDFNYMINKHNSFRWTNSMLMRNNIRNSNVTMSKHVSEYVGMVSYNYIF